MLSKNQIKTIQSLNQKKFRNKYNKFVVEGTKSISDILKSMDIELIVCTREWYDSHKNLVVNIEFEIVDNKTFGKCSQLKNPQEVLAIVKIPTITPNIEQINNSLSLALDGVQDPGNLGTIIRLADWFGIKNIICSKETVDAYNPKTVQATMGAIGRVNLIYTNLYAFLQNYKNNIFGTFLEGDIIYNTSLPNKGIIVMGNEGNGISDTIKQLVSKKLYIPDYPQNTTGSESLNVAVATAIICYEFRRNS